MQCIIQLLVNLDWKGLYFSVFQFCTLLIFFKLKIIVAYIKQYLDSRFTSLCCTNHNLHLLFPSFRTFLSMSIYSICQVITKLS